MVPPSPHQMDSSRSWLILASSFTCLFILSILYSSMAILQVEMIQDLQVGSGVVSIMTSLAMGAQNLLGPVSGALSNALSMRYTLFIGISLISVGMLCASFSYSLPSIFLFFIVTGIGNGLTLNPCIVVLSHHFEKRRMLANSILLGAPGLAVMCMPYWHRYIIDTCGWRYCMALNAALILHAQVCASFFTPTANELRGMVKFALCCEKSQDCHQPCPDDETSFGLLEKQDHNLHGKTIRNEYITNDAIQPDKNIFYRIRTDDNTSFRSLSLNTKDINAEKSCVPISDNSLLSAKSVNNNYTKTDSSHWQPFLQPMPNTQVTKSLSHLNRNTSNTEPITARSHTWLYTPATRVSELTPKSDKWTILTKSLEFAGSEMNLNLYSLVTPLPGGHTDQLCEEEGRLEDLSDQTLLAKIKRIIGFKALWILCLSCLLYLSGCAVHQLHFPSYVTSKGMSTQQVSKFYTIFGVVIVVGRLLGGALHNRLNPPLLPLLFILQILTGLSLGLAPFYATHPAGVFVMEAAFGLFFGNGFMVQAPIVAEMVGVEDLGLAFGIVQLFNGIGLIASPILAGFVYDVTGNLDIPMHLAGAFCLLGSFIVLAVIVLDKSSHAHKAKLALDHAYDSEVPSCDDRQA